MQKISDEKLRNYFVAWQCRIRQIAVRDYEGQPLPGLRPQVSLRSGELLLPAMTVLLIPENNVASSAYFRFQLQKTSDPAAIREAGIKYMAGGFYQEPELFSDEVTAVFGAGSELAGRMLRNKQVILDFEQFSQSFRMFCKVRQVPSRDEAHEASLLQARIFNPQIGNDADVLAFKPTWKSAAASPMPP